MTFFCSTALQLLCVPFIHFVARRVLPRDCNGQWFFLHSACNLITCKDVWTDLVLTFKEPLLSSCPSSAWPAVFAVLLHVYHAVTFPLSMDDRFHHLAFAFPLGLVSIAYSSRATNATLFFLNGFPGALIYGALVLKRSGLSLDEPRFSAFVNVLVRCPGIILSSMAYVTSTMASARGYANPEPGVLVLLKASASVGNALYYTSQSWHRYQRVVNKGSLLANSSTSSVLSVNTIGRMGL